jgi:hypothetical protein
VLLGVGLIVQSTFQKDIMSRSNFLSFTWGATALAVASVLNVLNTLSFILSPDRLALKVGMDLNWVLALDIANLIGVILVSLGLLASIYFKLLKVRQY